jgi:hypothetical protein
MPKMTSTPAHRRFRDYFNEGEWWECWEWQGGLTSAGYGLVGLGRRGEGFILAHRLSYETYLEVTIPSGMDLCHSCNNRKCVNPSHLYVGTRKDNMQQAKRDGRLHWQTKAAA